MDERSRIIIRLILKYYQCTLEADEKAELEEWLGEDERNRATLQHYGRFSEVVRDMRFYEETNKEVGLDKISRKVKHQQRRRKVRVRWITWGSVAASLIILWSLHVWLLEESLDVSPVMLALPNRSGVQLELSNGDLIALTETSVVKENDGTRVAVNDTAGIVYQNYQEGVKTEEVIIYNTVITPRGTEYLLTLSDGSKIWLNSDSRIKFPVKFAKGLRQVELVGEGYFDIVKDTISPFVVHCGGLEIKVTGTSFNIMAYPDEKVIQTTLVSGAVNVSCPDNLKVKRVALVPNQIALFSSGDEKIETKTVDISPHVAWHEGYICFHDEELGAIVKKLERWYDLTFEFDTPDTRQLVFYGSIKRHENISRVLDMLKYTNLIDFQIIDSKTIRVIRL